ncbi:hypothetical protein EJB05_06563 [Eragrostis curvula]|uniref:DUF4371 domain-containing protein n=1 Tax=Eragrostis curvula TaxID=38414 RepID=A0A5J9WFC9_9POAL|nr:hypothetical protein EJB05_06563 [Eragrostis curvula]
MDPFGARSDRWLGKRMRDAKTGEVQEDSSHEQIEIDRAIHLMRFVFKEGMAFLDNGSGRSLDERMMVDMAGYMVNEMFRGPGSSQRNEQPRMRAKTPTLENEIAHAFAKETRKCIASELQGDLFGIYVDVRSIRPTHKTYMVLFVRYLNGKGEVTERPLGIVPDPDVRHPAIKAAVDKMLSEAGLSWSNVRGQGYGMLGYDREIITEPMTSTIEANASAYHVHPHLCQLHSTLISASYGQFEVYEVLQLIDVLSKLVKDCPQFTEKVCTLVRDQRVNLDNDLKKAGETSWGSYYEALVKFAAYFTPVLNALEFVEETTTDSDHRYLAYKILNESSYDFVFGLLLMQDVLGVTNELSLALGRNGLDAENLALLLDAKKQLQTMKDEGWTPFLNKVGLFCSENEIHMPNMGETFKDKFRVRGNKATTMTNLEHYHVGFFENVINIHLNELNMRFSEQSSALVLSSCLNPRNSFQAFDKDKLIEYAQFYPSDFSGSNIVALDLQLESFISDMHHDIRFRGMNTLSALSVKMMETGKNYMYPLVYLLLKLALILPRTPATAAKTASSALKFIDSTITVEPCNQWFCDCLLLYLERELLENISSDAVIASL